MTHHRHAPPFLTNNSFTWMMKFAIVIATLLAFSLADLTCTDNQVYFKFRKQSYTYADEEFWTISNGGTVLYTSPLLENNKMREVETCIAASTNNQYQLKLKDEHGDSWYNGAYLEVIGVNGNIAFKGFLVDSNEETYTLSMYSPVNKNDQWKFKSNSVTGSWTDFAFPDTEWDLVTLGSVTVATSGTQYFRKTFAGLANMAAYELSMKYRYGIVAYVNGVEVHRDNMPDGTPTSTTPAQGGYTTIEYRGIIRPGNDVANSNSILAVELHFTQGAVVETVDFDAYLAIYAATTPDSNCYIYPYETTLTTSGSGTVANAWDWKKTSSYYLYSFTAPLTITAAMHANHAPFVNGIRFFPYTQITSSPYNYVLSGAATTTSEYQTIVSMNSHVYTASTFDTAITYFNGRISRNIQLAISSTSSGRLYLYEMQAAVCNVGDNISITFPETSYSFYAIYEDVSIAPTSSDFINCQINPQPPAGLSFDSATCKLTGKATAAASGTYTVTSTVNNQQYSGSFVLNIQVCSGSLLNIRRITRANAYAEAFSITDLSTNQIVSQQTLNGGQTDYSDSTNFICATGGKYRLTMEAALNYYQPYSFVVLSIILSNTETESLGLFNVDNVLGTPSTHDFKTTFEVSPVSTWYYKMGEVPNNWYSADHSNWSEGTTNNFVASSNQIQIYKKTFNVASTAGSAAVGINVRFRYGIIIYLNNVEVYRKGVTGDLSTSLFASSSYSSLAFHGIYLPVTTFGSTEEPSRNVIQQGSNTIAIALIAMNAQQTEATFDCTVRLTGEEHSNRVFGTTTTWSNVQYAVQSTDAFIGLHTLYVYGTNCNNNYLNMMYSNDRREWVSSIVLQNDYAKNEKNVANIIIEAKNAEDSTFTLLKNVTGLRWSYPGQTKRIWLNNNKPYNMYRFTNMGSGDSSNCAWKLNRIGVYADIITEAAPALSYSTNSVTVYKDVEMAEVYANSELFKDFTVSPPLPTGVSVDIATGMISGTAHAEQAPQTYIVSAKKYNTGEVVTASFTLEVTVCYGGKSLITMTVYTDSNPSQGSYKVFAGKGTSGQVVSQADSFPFANSLYYADFCLNHGIYTMQASSTGANGWTSPSGYMFSVDLGSLRYDVGQVPTTVTSMFSSYLPFQIEYDDWKVYKDTVMVADNWNTVEFDDSAWTVTKANAIGTSESVTVYIRRTFTIDDISNYQVLNVHIKYTGGVVAYFNGRRVARYNLAEIYNVDTESLLVHDANLYSKFHVILSTVGGQTGNNVIAFEIHRPVGTASSEPVVFDATGVFGVNDCSVVVDDYETLTSSSTTGSSIEAQFELAPYNSGYISNSVGSYIEWIVENLEGSKFNSFGMEVPQDAAGYGFSIYGYPELEGDERTSIFDTVNESFTNRQRKAFEVPVGIAGFRRYRLETDMASTTPVYVSTYLTQYCKASGTGGCAAMDDFPAVGEGQISPSTCGEGFRGYAYRECTNGQFSEIKTDQCIYKAPAYMAYPLRKYTFVKDAQNESDEPTYLNVITKFYLDEGVTLPEGMYVDEKTGQIKGTPTDIADTKTYTIYGSNPAGVTSTTISFSIRVGECKTEGIWETTTVGVTVTSKCSDRGSFVGTQTRQCILGTKDGEWQKVSGTCVSTPVIWMLVIVVIIIIVVIVIVIKVKSGKTTAKAGSKKAAKKGTVPKKTAKKDTKSVKV